jgi:hypothetical protein
MFSPGSVGQSRERLPARHKEDMALVFCQYVGPTYESNKHLYVDIASIPGATHTWTHNPKSWHPRRLVIYTTIEALVVDGMDSSS